MRNLTKIELVQLGAAFKFSERTGFEPDVFLLGMAIGVTISITVFNPDFYDICLSAFVGGVSLPIILRIEPDDK